MVVSLNSRLESNNKGKREGESDFSTFKPSLKRAISTFKTSTPSRGPSAPSRLHVQHTQLMRERG